MESIDPIAVAARRLPAVRDRRGREIALLPIEALIERISARWHPLQIWLFGSRGRGDAEPSSDWDLLVVVPDEVPEGEFDPVVGWHLQRASGVRADVIACRACNFDEDRSVPNTLAFAATHEGVLLQHEAYATSYRYPTSSGRVQQAPTREVLHA